MNNGKYLLEIMDKINAILEKHHAKAAYIPESLLVYAIIVNDSQIIEEFLKDGFTTLDTEQSLLEYSKKACDRALVW